MYGWIKKENNGQKNRDDPKYFGPQIRPGQVGLLGQLLNAFESEAFGLNVYKQSGPLTGLSPKQISGCLGLVTKQFITK